MIYQISPSDHKVKAPQDLVLLSHLKYKCNTWNEGFVFSFVINQAVFVIFLMSLSDHKVNLCDTSE